MAKLYQYSHFWGVNNGLYDGDMTISALRQYGNHGLGTFNSLAGELVAIKDEFFHCTGGKATKAEEHAQLPWAAVTDFAVEHTITISNINSFKELQALFCRYVGSKNYPYILHIEGSCHNISLGSTRKQTRPFQSIDAVIKDSVMIDTGTTDVDMVGFYAPQFMYPLKAQGLHLHFITKDRTQGGHVLDLALHKATLKFQQLTSFEILLPKHDEYKLKHFKDPQEEIILTKFHDRLTTD